MRDDWRSDAACGGAEDVFFGCGAIHEGSAPCADCDLNTAKAKSICATCPVRLECLEEALSRHPNWSGGGVWGGMTPKERAELKNHRTRHG